MLSSQVPVVDDEYIKKLENDVKEMKQAKLVERERERTETLKDKLESFEDFLDEQYKCGLCDNILCHPRTTICCGMTYCAKCIYKERKQKLEYAAEEAMDTLTTRVYCPSCAAVMVAAPLPNPRISVQLAALRNKRGLVKPPRYMFPWPKPHVVTVGLAHQRYQKNYELNIARRMRQQANDAAQANKAA
ncbi:hypothetical protein AAF712_011628 [Marasmius tenuissimus]|uniref:RING-type domain-containing protein n=1 Tax=Marasmius tenuissimus TaxID=585030 RepID=A0ABR2ZIX9_9AGAR